jgi:malonyl-CoA/methylmalonyl-CoA synthetase
VITPASITEPQIVSRARAHGQSVALTSGGLTLRYDELLEKSAAAAADLLDGRSSLAGARVALLLPAEPVFVIAQWAVWRAGGVCVPLSLHGTPAEWEHVLRDGRASSILTTAALETRVRPLAEMLGIAVRNPGSANGQLPDVGPSQAATILYTSGTTNKPKGVVITHANTVAQIKSLVEAWQWTASDRIPLFLPLHHIHGLVNVLACALWSGAHVEMLGDFDADRVLTRVAESAFTVFMAVPTIYVKLVAKFDSAQPDTVARWSRGFAAMRLMVSGSAALPASLHKRWSALTSQQLLERYGMTEIGMALSNPLHGERRPGSVGLPLPSVAVRLVDDNGNLVTAEDMPGEIQVRGSGVFREYWDRAAETAASFDGQWFRTGDVAVIERGYFRIMGRRSVDIIKSGGYKLSALEIEAALLEHPSIAECAVVGLPHETWGEAVTAAVVVRPNQVPPSLQELRDWCRSRLSPYKLPHRVETFASLPRNAMGKVTKPAVVKLLAAM